MTKPSRMIRAVATTGLAALVLTGCAGARPGVAVQVGDQEITTVEVDRAAEHLCTALEGQLEAENNTVPMSYVRQGVVQLLTIRAQVEQVADEYGVKPGKTYTRDRAQKEAAAEVLPEEVRADYVDLTSTQTYYSDIADQVGRLVLEEQGVTDPTVEQISQAGSDVFAVWPDAHGVEIDPRYGLGNVDGQLQPIDTNLSVAVSERAESGLAEQPDPAYARTLPERQRCG